MHGECRGLVCSGLATFGGGNHIRIWYPRTGHLIRAPNHSDVQSRIYSRVRRPCGPSSRRMIYPQRSSVHRVDPHRRLGDTMGSRSRLRTGVLLVSASE